MEVSVSISKSDFSHNILWPKLDLEVPTSNEFTKVPRPKGYSIPNLFSGMIRVQSGDLISEGYADGDDGLIETKATSEALERLVMSAFARQLNEPDTSNGWACHHSLGPAIQNALCELVERDVALTSWEKGDPFYLVPENLWPKYIREWSLAHRGHLEYSNLNIALSESYNGCAVSVFLFNSRGNCVGAHSSKHILSEAISSAFMECLRAAHSALRFEHIAEVKALHQNIEKNKWNPGAHSVAYAYEIQFPNRISLVDSSASEIKLRWSRHQNILRDFDLSKFEILAFNIMGRVAVRLRYPKLRQIYWGPAKNRDELINKHPHTVG